MDTIEKLFCRLAIAWLLLAGLAHASPPQLDARGRTGYAEFLQAATHRAFVIAPGGNWSWRGDMESPELALQAALQDCQSHARRTCFAYALDAKQAPVGVKPGQRFPDLVWRDAGGREHNVSEQHGRVVLLHFWGSWCPPCQREMPDLKKLYARLKAAPNMQFVFLPVREAAARSRGWLRSRGIALPIADAGALAEKEGTFLLGSGGKIGDRDLARVFPTTYILDRNGIVLFAHVGPVADWLALEPLLKDAAK